MKRIRLPELPGVGRLGRHVAHDPRSRAFKVQPASNVLKSAVWHRYVLPFDQGTVGSCTGNALGGVLGTAPFYAGSLFAVLKSLHEGINESLCVRLYSAATREDDIDGVYPPDDTGSSGLAVCKAAKKMGLIGGYAHAFSLHDALLSLGNDGPQITGINWYEGFDKPIGRTARLEIGGGVRGGHELAVTWVDIDARLIGGPQSWGPNWGNHGFWSMSFDTWERLLDENGDVTIPRRLGRKD